MSTILGVHMGHDASVCLLENGKPVFCLSEERLVRKKLYYGFPLQALEYVLNWSGKSPEQITCVAFDTLELPALIGPDEMLVRFNPGKKLIREINKGKKAIEYFLGRGKAEEKDKEVARATELFYQELKKLGFGIEKTKIFDHHLSHSASAFWGSPFKDAMIVTSDGRGDSKSATLGYGSGSKLDMAISIDDLNSIGQFYAAVTFYLGFRPNRHEGKITGLAAHGDKFRLGKRFLNCIHWQANGSFSFDIPEKYRADSVGEFETQLAHMPLSLKDRIIIHSQRNMDTLLYTANWYSMLNYLNDLADGLPKEDVAAGVQFLAEEVSAEFVRRNLKNAPIPITLAGGVFANVRVNQKIREIPGISNIFVQPAMGDQGLSLGSAYLAYAEVDPAAEQALNATVRPTQIENMYLGPVFSDDDILAAGKKFSLELKKVENIEEEIGKWIHEGHIIGYYQGRMEFGPRALGHRSILARPTDSKINEDLNIRLKRTEFMPFAPSILQEYSAKYFIDYDKEHVASEYMTMTYDIPPENQVQIPAVVHVDGTARPQVVRKDKEAKYHKIISAYHQQSGIPLIINTSFNTHEEPIVCSPEDAIRSYETGCVDILVMEDYVVGAPLGD